jgi:hypothetical protein
MGSEALDAVRRYQSAVVAHGRRDGDVPGVAIQPRDLELIDCVRRYKFLTTPQLLELFWSGRSPQAARMRLVALFRAGFLDRFRPVADRGSFPWTYQLGPEGHRLLVRAGILPARSRFESREVFDYSYVLHEIGVNSWVIEWRRRLGERLLSWEGEVQIEPPDGLDKTGSRRHISGDVYVEWLKDWRARPVRPDAILEVRTKAGGINAFFVEYDRTRRVDKNFDKFRRYDNFLCWWAPEVLGPDVTPWVIFVCQTAADCTRFVDAADSDLTGQLTGRDERHIGRRRLLFTVEADMYEPSEVIAQRVPPTPWSPYDKDEGPRMCDPIRFVDALPGAV